MGAFIYLFFSNRENISRSLHTSRTHYFIRYTNLLHQQCIVEYRDTPIPPLATYIYIFIYLYAVCGYNYASCCSTSCILSARARGHYTAANDWKLSSLIVSTRKRKQKSDDPRFHHYPGNPAIYIYVRVQ